MRYLCLVYHEESLLAAMSKDEMEVCVAESVAFDRELERSGHMVTAHALQPVRSARSIRVRGGRKMVTDGPFAETKEQLVGFVLIEAASEEEAIDLGARIPLARTGTIELRAVMAVNR